MTPVEHPVDASGPENSGNRNRFVLNWLVETTCLPFAVGGCAYLAATARYRIDWGEIGLVADIFGPGLLSSLADKVLLASPVLLPLLWVKLIRNRTLALLGAGALMLGSMSYLALVYMDRHAEAFAAANPLTRHYFGEFIHLAAFAKIAVRMATPILAIVGGLAVYTIWNRKWCFILGGAAIGFLTYYLTSALPLSLTEFRAITGLLLNMGPESKAYWGCLLLLLVVWYMPHLRRSLFNLIGINENGTPTRSYPLGLMVFSFCLTVVIAASVTVGRCERAAREMIERPPAILASPNLTNAWDAVERWLDETEATQAAVDAMPTLRHVNDAQALVDLEAALTPAVRLEIAAPDPDALRCIGAVRVASGCDYYGNATPIDKLGSLDKQNWPLYVGSCWLAAQARLYAIDGNWRSSLANIDTLLRFAGLTPEGDFLGAIFRLQSARQLAIGAGTSYWQAFRDDQEAMLALAEVLTRNAPGNLRSLPVDMLRRVDLGFQRINVFTSSLDSVPNRSIQLYQGALADYDRLRIVVALELYRLEHGAYPETLESLMPDLLTHIPRDAFEGEPYIYGVLDEGIALERRALFLGDDPLAWQVDDTKKQEFLFPTHLERWEPPTLRVPTLD